MTNGNASHENLFAQIIKACLTGVTTLGAGIGASMLFSGTIPRQDGGRDDLLKRFADAEKLKEYMKKIDPVREWIDAQTMEDLYITSRDGLRLHALYLPAAEPSDKLIIIHHGFTSKARDIAIHAKFFHELDYEVMLLDLRAHGESEGDYVGFGILDRFDTLAWVKFARERFGEGVSIVLHGTSMGASTTLMSLGLPEIQENVSAAIADCGFTSPAEVFASVIKIGYHIPTPEPIIKEASKRCLAEAGYAFDEYSTIEALKENQVPVLFIHGSGDNFVPTYMSEENYEACSSQKKLLIVEGAWHGASVFEDEELYEQTEKEFLEEAGL